MNDIKDPIGRMNQRIKIASLVNTRDEIGGNTRTWTLGCEISAAVIHRATGTDEEQTANQKTPDGKVDFIIRFRSVGYQDEIDYRGKRYKIEGIVPDAHRHFLTIETRYHG